MTVVKTIGTGAGLNVTPDYADIAAWFTYLRGLGTLTDHQVGRILWASSANEIVVTTAQVMDTVTIGAFTITLEAGDANGAAGGSFRDNANKLTNALRYNASNGACIRYNGTTVATVFQIKQAGMTVRNLQFSVGNQVANGGYAMSIETPSGTAAAVTNCIFDINVTTGTPFSFYGMGANNTVVSNCLFVVRSLPALSGPGVDCYPRTNQTIVNCDFVNLDSRINSSNCMTMEQTDASFVFRNNILYGFAVDVGGTTSGTFSNCATSLASGSSTLPGTAHQYSMVGATEFVSVTQATPDLRLASTSVKCKDLGTATNAPTTDIVGQARA